MGKVIINQQEFSFQQIKEGEWSQQVSYFEDTLRFCREWLSGKELFELRTSGSTGKPKTITISRAQMSSSARATGIFFDIQAKPRLLCCLHTAMVAGKMMLVRAMEWDSDLYLVEPSSDPLTNFPVDQRFDFVAMVPLQLETCLAHEYSRIVLRSIRNLIIGGAQVSSVLREKANNFASNVFQTYGMTETVSHIALANLQSDGPLIYHTLPNVTVRQTKDLVLKIKAPMSNNEWILTTDIVEIISEKEFIWKGRSDFTINTGGVKVQPEEIEAMISNTMEKKYPNRRYFIAGIPDLKLGQKIVMLIEGENESPLSSKQVMDSLKFEVPPYHDPKSIYFITQFEETASNKINRQSTVERLIAQKESFL